MAFRDINKHHDPREFVAIDELISHNTWTKELFRLQFK